MPLYIMDVADVTFERKSDGHVVFTSEAQMSSLSQTVDEETINGGIGSRTLYTIKSNKQLELSVRNATFDLEWLAMTQGVAVNDDGKLEINEESKATVGQENKVNFDVDGVTQVSIVNDARESQKADVEEGVIDIPEGFASEGDNIMIIIKKEVHGKSVQMRADRFSEKYKVQYRTICLDTKTDKVDSDLYIVFNEVSPSSAFDMSLENGTAFTPELTFVATSDDKSVIGTMILVPREED